jgi:hypothetical protein
MGPTYVESFREIPCIITKIVLEEGAALNRALINNHLSDRYLVNMNYKEVF